MIKSINEGFDRLLNETSCKESDTRRFDRRDELGDDVAKYQRWVDYDMKRFGRISKRTTDTLHKAGLDVTKDQYGDYEVISKSPITEGKRYGQKNFYFETSDGTYSFYCSTEDTRYGFRHLCDVFKLGEHVGEAVARYYNRTWESYQYESVLLKAVDNIVGISDEARGQLIDKIEHREDVREKKCNEEIDKKGEKDIIAWWEDVEKWNSENGSPFNVDNDKSDIEGMHIAMFDMLRELKDKAEDLYKRGKKIYNRYAFSKLSESEDDGDIPDDEYYAELEKHIAEIPSYDYEKLKAEYKEFKDSTHEDDIRVETALKDEMVKRGFLFVYEGMKVLNENAPNFAVQDGLPIYAFLNYEEEYDNIRDRAKEEYEGTVNDDDWDEFLEDFEEKYWDEYLKGYAVIDPYNDEFDQSGKTLTDAIKDFNDMLKGLANKAYDASYVAWRDYENARDSEDVSDEDVNKLEDKANELDGIYSYLRDLELSIQSGYHQGYQLYLDGWDDIPDDFPQEYTDAIIDAYNKVGKDFHLMKLGLAWQASNGEAGYSLIED